MLSRSPLKGKGMDRLAGNGIDVMDDIAYFFNPPIGILRKRPAESGQQSLRSRAEALTDSRLVDVIETKAELPQVP
jgi:hypothetical protein